METRENAAVAVIYVEVGVVGLDTSAAAVRATRELTDQ